MSRTVSQSLSLTERRRGNDYVTPCDCETVRRRARK
jgi:hypothetical protein